MTASIARSHCLDRLDCASCQPLRALPVALPRVALETTQPATDGEQGPRRHGNVQFLPRNRHRYGRTGTGPWTVRADRRIRSVVAEVVEQNLMCPISLAERRRIERWVRSNDRVGHI